MILSKKGFDQGKTELYEVRKEYLAALEDFKRRANTPKSIQHGADMDELVHAYIASNERVLEFIESGRYPEAARQYMETSTAIYARLRAKATEAEQWQEQLVTESEQKRKDMASTILMVLVIGSLFSVAAAILGGILLARGIASPLAQTVAHLGEIAKGDLSKDAPADFQARADEIGMLARAQQTMLVSVRAMVQEISGGIQVLSSSSTELLASSAQMTSGSRNASDRAHSVAAAAEEMSSNVTSVAAGMEQATTNLANVSLATDQMTSTIGEIAGNSEKARRITADATRQAARITEQINQLGQAAREIGKVTETITEISSQTNLLALNATIEAARAGSAGKGFAVVATEIKALAQQTAAATEDIKTRIAGVQSATAGGIAEIEKIAHVIEEVSAIVTTIAAAIEEQATATKDIARNIAEASLGVTDANTRVSETSHVSRGIAKDIGDVDHAAGEMASGSDHVRSSATELSTVAEHLKLTAARFHV
jgi:methyl-accepting chemotaxis protein